MIALGALLLAGCHKEQLSAPESLPVVTVRVQSIELKSHVATEDAVGTVRPKLHSVIEAKVSAQIEKMLVVPGQRVKTGELLAQLDVREIQAKLDQALPVRRTGGGRSETLFDTDREASGYAAGVSIGSNARARGQSGGD